MIHLSNHQLDGILNKINDFIAHLVLTVGTMCLFPDGKSSYLSCTKWVGYGYHCHCMRCVSSRLTTIAVSTSPE